MQYVALNQKRDKHLQFYTRVKKKKEKKKTTNKNCHPEKEKKN